MSALPRVYAAGSTPLAYFVGSQIAMIPRQPSIPEIILLLNDQKKLDRFLSQDSKFSIQFKKNNVLKQIQLMAACSPPIYSTGELATIPNLIVSEPTSSSFYITIKKYLKSLDSDSNVLLINPEFGLIKNLRKKFWNNDTSAPNIFIGQFKNHNKFVPSVRFARSEFQVRVNNHQLDLVISPVPKISKGYSYSDGLHELESLKVKNPLLKLISEASINSIAIPKPVKLNVDYSSYGDHLLLRVEELIVNSCIDSLVVLYKCQTSADLLKVPKIQDIKIQLIKEQILIINRSLKFIPKIPNSKLILHPKRLVNMIEYKLLHENKDLSKNKIQSNYLNLKHTDFRPETFIKLAKNRKIECPWNETIVELTEEQKLRNRKNFFDYRKI